MVFVVRACAPGRTHRALVPAGCGFVPAGLRTALLPGLAPCLRGSGLEGGMAWGGVGFGWVVCLPVTPAEESLSCTVWKGSCENMINTFRIKLSTA